MLFTFQLVLLVAIILSFFTAIGVTGENGQKAAGLCFASIVALTSIFLWV